MFKETSAAPRHHRSHAHQGEAVIIPSSGNEHGRPGRRRFEMRPRTSAVCVLLATAAMLSGVWWLGLREPAIVLSEQDEKTRLRGSDLSVPGGTLAIAAGDQLPRWQVEGWLNGTPPTSPPQVIVADVWNDL